MSEQNQPPKMTDNKPYLIRALYDWIVDNDCTPFLTVQADIAGVQVPREFVQDGKITLSVAPRAVQSLNLGNEDILFSATFGGELQDVRLPCRAVLAIFARENGQGMMFEVKPESGPTPPANGGSPDSKNDKRPKLKVVK